MSRACRAAGFLSPASTGRLARAHPCGGARRVIATCSASNRASPASPSPVRRIAVTLALAHALCCGAPAVAPATAAEVTAPPAAESETTPAAAADTERATEAELREMSRRNTRVSGKPVQLFTRARRAAELGDLDGALQLYNQLIAAAPSFAPGYSNRANLLVSRGRLQPAVSDYDEALRLAPLDKDAWLVHVNRGCARAALGEDARAVLVDDFERAYAQRGDDPVVLSNRAGLYERLGKWDAALRDYQSALSGNEVKPFWLRYGLALFQRGRGGESVAILRRVIMRFDVDDARAALAVVLFDKGDVAAAETLWTGMQRPRLFESRKFLDERLWPPRAVDAMDRFRALKE